MDLYTAASRLSQRFRPVPGESAPSLGEYALIGDGASCALVGVDGSIGWACLPRFDSPSVFASILDPERGGTCRVSPCQPFESLQAYDEATNVVQTLFRTERGVAQLTDFMPWSSDDERFSVNELHRLIEVREGALDLEVVFDPRFDYARGKTHVAPAEGGAPGCSRWAPPLGPRVRAVPGVLAACRRRRRALRTSVQGRSLIAAGT